MTETNIGKCSYCGKMKPLCKSHIIPKSFYPLRGHKKHYIAISFSNAQSKFWQSGVWVDNILCKNCDNTLGKEEGYVSNLLLNRLISYKVENDERYLIPSNEYDYLKIKKFFIFLLWKTSIAKHPAFVLNLKEYEEVAKKMLTDESLIVDKLFDVILFKNNGRFSQINYIQRKVYLGATAVDIGFGGFHAIVFPNSKNTKLDDLGRLFVLTKGNPLVVGILPEEENEVDKEIIMHFLKLHKKRDLRKILRVHKK